MLSILLVEDHLILPESLFVLLNKMEDMKVMGVANTARERFAEIDDQGVRPCAGGRLLAKDEWNQSRESDL